MTVNGTTDGEKPLASVIEIEHALLPVVAAPVTANRYDDPAPPDKLPAAPSVTAL